MISVELTIHLQGAVLNSKVSMMKSVAVAFALAAGISGSARADDSSLDPFTGDSYAYFNGGNRGHITNPPVFAKTPSWHQANPNGLAERQLQALSSSSASSAYDTAAPLFDKAQSAWRQANPNGLSERELQAISSEGPAWHSSPQSTPSALAITKYGVFANRPAN